MNQKENAAPVLAHGKAAGAGFRTRDAVNPSLSYHTAGKKATEKTAEIFENLPVGAENSISPAVLAARMGFNSLRSLRNAIEQERQAGALILSSFNGGYYRPSEGAKGRQEVEEFYYSQKAHAVAILRRLKAAGRALGVVDGQITLDD